VCHNTYTLRNISLPIAGDPVIYLLVLTLLFLICIGQQCRLVVATTFAFTLEGLARVPGDHKNQLIASARSAQPAMWLDIGKPDTLEAVISQSSHTMFSALLGGITFYAFPWKLMISRLYRFSRSVSRSTVTRVCSWLRSWRWQHHKDGYRSDFII
jgi:hypothetical protein